MEGFPIDSHWLALLGIVIVIISLLSRLRQRLRQNVQRQAERQKQIESAREAEIKQKQTAALPRSAVGKTVSPDRMPMPDPFGTPFTGGIPAQFARWEAEIHKLGRMITGQIDSKMAALQAITQDANRTAHRLEILVEHLEKIARQQIERQQAASSRTVSSTETDGRFLPVDHTAAAELPAAEATPLAAVLKELNADLDKIHKSISDNPLPPEMIAPVKLFRPAVTPAEDRQPGSQPQLPVRREVEMLADYGYDTEEIARQLNISAGEVDLILQLQGK